MHNIINNGKEFLWNNKAFDRTKITHKIDKWETHPTNKYKFSFNKNPTQEADYDIFTDGSSNEHGAGSAFVVIKSGKIIDTKQYSLPNYSNNFEAEAVAIKKALEYITLQNNSASYQILTDSLSTLQGISNPDNLNPYIYQIKEIIRKVNKNHKILLTFIKGHSGNIGNEYADDLAKKAIRYGEEIDLPISKKFINSQLYKQIYIKWNIVWNQEPNLYKSYIKEWIKNITEIPTLFLANYNSSQFMTGHGRFPHYLQRFGIRQNKICTCGEEADSFEHYLEKCEITRKYRDKLKMKFGHGYSKKKVEILRDGETIAILEEMVEEVNYKI
ncbi:uncharacterized protein [Dermacentor albipictus]|uniref:uncharacterized protein n=1 Tax=Dermacentor albipictus TaxID=60249 RepID=UPI0038FC65EB